MKVLRVLLAASLTWTPVTTLWGQAISGSIDGKSVVASATPAHLRSVVTSLAGVAAPRIPSQAKPASPAGRVGSRVFLGVLGSATGIFVGAYAGYHLLPRRDCGDDPGLCEAVMGAMIGSVLGAAIGTAAPAGPEGCTFGRRFAPALLGAVVGGAAGWVVARGNGIILLTVPVGATIGGVAGAELCRR